jgi:hypothetical protein
MGMRRSVSEFQVHRGGDPEGIYIDAYTKADDGFDVLDLTGLV